MTGDEDSNCGKGSVSTSTVPSSRSNKIQEDVVEFSTPSKSSLLVGLLLLLGPLLCLLSIIPTVLDPNSTPDDKRIGVIIVLLSTIGILILYVFVIPTGFEVRRRRQQQKQQQPNTKLNENIVTTETTTVAVLGVRTLFVTYKFPYLVRAFREEGISLNPKFKFAMNLNDRVCVKRKRGYWDLLVSPQDIDGFMRAVNNLVLEIDAQDGEGKQFLSKEVPQFS